MKILRLLIFIQALVLVGTNVPGQEKPEQTGFLSNLKGLEQQAQRPGVIPTVPLDEAINPDEYLVGPGDGLALTIIGDYELNLVLNITPEGTLIIPTIGEIELTGFNLSGAKEKIQQAVKSKYLNVMVATTLVTLRTFRVAITGAVNIPGVYPATHASRVSDIVELAGGFQMPLAVSQEQEMTFVETPNREETVVKTSKAKELKTLQVKPASERNIKLYRKTGEVIHVDLERFKFTGEMKVNSRLWDGDVINVPVIEGNLGQLGIYGAVKKDGEFEYAAGDDLGILIKMAHGLTFDADSSYIEIIRFQKDGKSTERIVGSFLENNNDGKIKLNESFSLQPDDRIFVRSIAKYHAKYQVTVEGEVNFPGEFGITENNTRLSTIIDLAGGFTRDAALINAKVIRRAVEEIQDPEYERLKKMLVADMTEQERDYFKVKSRELAGAMGIDFVKLFVKGDKSQDIVLKDRDRIVIPAAARTVNVTGQVINPGLITHIPSKSLRYYIQEAGGYSWNARKSRIRVIRAATGEWEKPTNDTIIELGDTIFVPEKPERDWWLISRDIIAVTAQVATVLLVISQAAK